MHRRAIWLIIALACAPVPALGASFAEELAARLHAGAGGAAGEAESEAVAILARFYRARDMAPVWVTGRAAGPRAARLAAILAAADEDALDPADYGVAAIDALLGATRPDLLAELEVRLGLGLLRYAADLGQGRTTPNVADPELYPYRDEVDRAAVIAGAARSEDLAAFVDRYRPQTPRYDRLKKALADYRALAAAGGWAPIPDGPALKPGMRDPRVALLRARLRLWGDLSAGDDAARAGGDPARYDEALARAVEWMQYRHGLLEDGIVGRETLAALNVPVEARLEQIVLNLERRRWMPDDLGARYVFVNLADFKLKVVFEPKTVLDMRVVIGKRYHKTPIFSQDMTYVVINPYWNVPPSIARKELLPQIKKNVNFLAEKNFTLFSDWSGSASVVDPAGVDWSAVDSGDFPYKVRQDAGDGNALGRIKFMFPNRFNVYLHDTPAKSLFRKAERDFSHGCIRVEKPVGLAATLLAADGWPRERIEAAIEAGERAIVTLSRPVPVHVSYLTSWVNKDGSVHFRKDVYGRDAILADALLGPRAARIGR